MTLDDYRNHVRTFGKIGGRAALVPEVLHQVVMDVCGRRPYWWNVGTSTLSTVANQVNYPLSSRVDGRRVLILNDETGDNQINLVSLAKHLFSDPTPTETGTPYDFSFIGQHSVQGVPSAASLLSLVSTSAADTSQKVVVRGLVSGVERYEVIDLNGVAAVSSTLTYDASQYLEIQKSAATTGIVTITSNASAVTIATIPPEDLKLEIPWIRFRYVPSSVKAIRYWFYKRDRVLTSLYEIPDVPDIAHLNVLLSGLLKWMHASGGDYNQSTFYDGEMEKGIVKLNVWSDSQPGKIDIKECRTTGVSPRFPELAPAYTMG